MPARRQPPCWTPPSALPLHLPACMALLPHGAGVPLPTRFYCFSVLVKASRRLVSHGCRAQLREIFESGTTLQLQFPAEDLGFTYPSVATAASRLSTAEPWRDHAAASAKRSMSHYQQRPAAAGRESIDAAVDRIKLGRRVHASQSKFQPRFAVGGRLPHFDLLLHGSSAGPVSAAWDTMPTLSAAAAEGHGGGDADQGRSVCVSSVDLAHMNQGRMVCVVHCMSRGKGSSGGACSVGDNAGTSELLNLLAVCESAQARVVLVSSGPELPCLSGQDLGADSGERMPLNTRQLRAFAREHEDMAVWYASDVSHQLLKLSGGQELSALVRPDGHISCLVSGPRTSSNYHEFKQILLQI